MVINNLDASLIEAVGWAAAGAGLFSTYSRTMIPLRMASIMANVLFIGYGTLRGILPTVIINCILLPLNAVRLRDVYRLIAQVRDASTGSLSAEWLRSFVTRKRYLAGETLWQAGDEAGEAFYVFSGVIELPEIGKRLEAGTLAGEMGLFDPKGKRLVSARCVTDVEVGTITYDEFRMLYFQNPDFGFHLLRLVGRRMRENLDAGKVH